MQEEFIKFGKADRSETHKEHLSHIREKLDVIFSEKDCDNGSSHASGPSLGTGSGPYPKPRNAVSRA